MGCVVFVLLIGWFGFGGWLNGLSGGRLLVDDILINWLGVGC